MAESFDKLHMSDDPECQRMLEIQGDNKPDKETVLYSNNMIKINRKEKEQTRTLLITNKAVYSCKPKSISKVQRRIALSEIGSVTLSTTSGEFVLHVPREYDYRYKSNDNEDIAKVLKRGYGIISKGKTLPVQMLVKEKLFYQTVTKSQAKEMTMEERERRLLNIREMMYKGMPRQEDDDEEKHEGDVVNMLKSEETKVSPDDFDFLKVIGRGAFGKVMQVKYKKTGNIYAMKILRKKQIVDSNQIDHTKSERKILEALQHPFLMQLRFAFQTPSKLYFVLDYYRGGELFFHLKKKRRFSQKETRFFIAEVALALGHLHSKDIIYRDLKPENILLHQTGHICLTDFGLSKDLAPMTDESHTFCGTPEYLAPEIIQKQGHGKAVDWWSLGVLCYELSTGQPPFYSSNLHTMYRMIRTEDAIFPDNLSAKCISFIKNLLKRNPKERLGYGEGGLSDVQRHRYWEDLNWSDLLELKVDPPYKPTIRSIMDTSNFSTEFTEEIPEDTFVERVSLPPEEAFNNFTYKPAAADECDMEVGTDV